MPYKDNIRPDQVHSLTSKPFNTCIVSFLSFIPLISSLSNPNRNNNTTESLMI